MIFIQHHTHHLCLGLALQLAILSVLLLPETCATIDKASVTLATLQHATHHRHNTDTGAMQC